MNPKPAVMTRWGVGPTYAFGSILVVAALSLINIFGYPDLTLPHNLLSFGLGVGLFVVGFAILVFALVQVHSAFGVGKLVTTGVYAYFRDPVYAVWILFMMPGFILITGLLLLVIAPFLMYILLKALISKEEKYLELTFGKKYLDYKSNVNSVIPRLFKRSKKMDRF
jgi:protein-S-isoprenylcysteine O-methyltransferase Ste14